MSDLSPLAGLVMNLKARHALLGEDTWSQLEPLMSKMTYQERKDTATYFNFEQIFCSCHNSDLSCNYGINKETCGGRIEREVQASLVEQFGPWL